MADTIINCVRNTDVSLTYQNFGLNQLSLVETRKKQVTHSNTNPAVCSTLRMRTAISPVDWFVDKSRKEEITPGVEGGSPEGRREEH